MTLSQTFLQLKPETEADWQSKLAEGGCFVVAEAAINDAVPWLAERWGGSLEQTRLYWGESGRIHASISPYCIPANPANWPQLREHLLTQEGWGIGIQLEWFMRTLSPLDQLLDLVKHLRQWSLVETQDGEHAILRISDWQVITPLLAASTVNEATSFYGPVATFWQLGCQGNADSLALTQREYVAQPLVMPRQLSDPQWQAILAPSDNRVLVRYSEHLRQYHPRWREADDAALTEFIVQQRAQAQQHGFNNDRDIVRYLALATELEPEFIASDWAQPILQQADYIGTESRMDRLYRRAIEQLDKA